MRAAAADIALQGLIDVRLAGIRIGLQEAHAAQDHSRGAVRTLKRAGIEERLLDRMQAPVFFQTLDSHHGFSRSRARRDLAGSPRRSANQYGTSTALPFPAAVFAAGQSKLITQNIQKRRIRRVVDRIALAVNFQFGQFRHGLPSEKFCSESVLVASVTSSREDG